MPEATRDPSGRSAGATLALSSPRLWIVAGAFLLVMGAIAGLTLLFRFGLHTDPKLVLSPLVQRPAPGFALTEMNTGEKLSLEQLRGTPFLLNFWASWCVACRDEAHVLEVAHQRWGGDPAKFRVIGIAIQDTPEEARKFAKHFGKTYYLALDDTAGDVSLNYGLYGVPESFFVDARGVIRYKQIGAMTPAVLEAQIPALMAEVERQR
jgi:cytochrome c biogenesis protein CcmG, thiol:disulfide interchange protein DsbE